VEWMLRVFVWQSALRERVRGRARDQLGEGVISAAIAVLVMAFLGVLMWQLFGDTLRKANTNVNDRLDQMK
jgi:hypothetical protein